MKLHKAFGQRPQNRFIRIGLVIIIQVICWVNGVAGDINTEFAEAFFIMAAENRGGVGLTAIQLAKLLHADLGGRIGSGANGQSDEDFFTVQSWILIA